MSVSLFNLRNVENHVVEEHKVDDHFDCSHCGELLGCRFSREAAEKLLILTFSFLFFVVVSSSCTSSSALPVGSHSGRLAEHKGSFMKKNNRLPLSPFLFPPSSI